jgi:hypothetical protein
MDICNIWIQLIFSGHHRTSRTYTWVTTMSDIACMVRIIRSTKWNRCCLSVGQIDLHIYIHAMVGGGGYRRLGRWVRGTGAVEGEELVPEMRGRVPCWRRRGRRRGRISRDEGLRPRHHHRRKRRWWLLLCAYVSRWPNREGETSLAVEQSWKLRGTPRRFSY